MLNYLFELFGIQQTQANFDNFKIAFWSGFIYTLFCSILVGLFLMWLERRISKWISKKMEILKEEENKMLKKKWEDEEFDSLHKAFQSYKKELNTYFSLPTVIIPDNHGLFWIPSNYVKIINAYPPYITSEQKQNNRYVKFVNLFKKFNNITKLYEEFKIVSDDITFEINEKISENIYQFDLSKDELRQQIKEFNDDASIGLKKLQNAGDEIYNIRAKTIFTIINEFNEYPSYGVSSAVLKFYEDLQGDENINRKIRKYKDKKMELTTCINDLK
ncbi:hypothetical protein, partial [Bacillus rhizoplanae]